MGRPAVTTGGGDDGRWTVRADGEPVLMTTAALTNTNRRERRD